MLFEREKKVRCGADYLSIDVFTCSSFQTRRLKKLRSGKESTPKAIYNNDKQAKKKFIRLINTNFNNNDYRLDLTYSMIILREQAEKQAAAFIRRLKRLYKKHGKELKYILVTEGGKESRNGKYTRVHHHLIINGGIDRDIIEHIWKQGRTSCAYLQPIKGENGLEKLALYLLKGERDKKSVCRWSGSRNLKKPTETINDNKNKCGTVARYIEAEKSGNIKQRIENKYKGYTLIEYNISINPVTGWKSIEIKMYRKQELIPKTHTSRLYNNYTYSGTIRAGTGGNIA